jgi:hypothetical protein
LNIAAVPAKEQFLQNKRMKSPDTEEMNDFGLFYDLKD